MSLLQKAIRRGQVRLAGQAAASLYRVVGPAIWRRLVVIVCEDVGVACEGALKFAVHAAERHARGRGARDEQAAVYLARKLASLPKDRTADHLVSIALHHPSVASTRLKLHRAATSVSASVLLDRSLPLPVRATTILMLATREVDGVRRFKSGGLGELIAVYRLTGMSTSLVEATERAARMTREPIAIFAPLIHATAFAAGPPPVRDVTTPATRVVNALPVFLADKHTAIGKAAIGRFVAESRQMQAVLAAFVPRTQWNIAAATAAFHADAASVARKVVWPGSDELERLGAEGDLFRDRVPLDGARPLIECVRANLDHLNDIRARLLLRRFSQR